MEIKIFRSNKGDCLLISNDFPRQKNRHILIDGGMKGSFRDHVSPELHKIISEKEVLDLVCVSHIDEDHILGIIELLDHVIDWRIFNHLKDDPERNVKAPKFPEPPPIKQIWHNAFSEIVDDNAGDIAQALAHTAQILGQNAFDKKMVKAADYATSIKQAIQLSRKINAKQLGIPLNKQHDQKLVLFKQNQEPIKVGRFKITIIGPSETVMEKLREDWNEWLKENTAVLEGIQRNAAVDEQQLQQGALSLLSSILASEEELGDRNKVTLPNLASIMFLLEDRSKKVLLTGDGHSTDILEGLELTNKLQNGRIHLDVLKVQHHGSEFNIDADFCQKVTADHYIFCGNGAHHNPNLTVLKTILNSRMGTAEQLSPNAETANPFKFWFNSSSAITSTSRKPHMKEIEELMAEQKAESGGQFDFAFMGEGKGFLSLKL